MHDAARQGPLPRSHLMSSVRHFNRTLHSSPGQDGSYSSGMLYHPDASTPSFTSTDGKEEFGIS